MATPVELRTTRTLHIHDLRYMFLRSSRWCRKNSSLPFWHLHSKLQDPFDLLLKFAEIEFALLAKMLHHHGTDHKMQCHRGSFCCNHSNRCCYGLRFHPSSPGPGHGSTQATLMSLHDIPILLARRGKSADLNYQMKMKMVRYSVKLLNTT